MLRAILILLIVSWPLTAQSYKVAPEEGVGGLGHVHVHWPAPESLLKDLRSTDDGKRLTALDLLGVPHPMAQDTPNPQDKAPTAPSVAQPDNVELRYESLGADSEQQAIIGAVIAGSYVFGAVAMQGEHGWERIANFSCWCKYERGDLLAGVIRVEYGAGGFELVLRGSSGGTGLYVQGEAHYRLRRGELHQVLSFTSDYEDCNFPTPQARGCEVKRRWFYSGSKSSVLIESRSTIPQSAQIEVEQMVPDLELRHIQSLSCTKYLWDAKTSEYMKSSSIHACAKGEVEW